jgi:hypothetical protein
MVRAMTSVCHRDYDKKRFAQDHQFFIQGRIVHKNIKFYPSIYKSITLLRHSLTKSTFRLAENGDGPSFSSHPKHSTDREGSTHAVYSETPRLQLFNEIGVYRVLTKSKGRESTEFLKKVFVDLQKCGVSQHNHQGHPAEMSLWYKNHVKLP